MNTSSATTIPAHNRFELEGGIVFSSNFDNGNIAKVERIAQKGFEFKIWTAPDNAGTSFQSKHCAWFYFVVTGLPMGCVLRMQIINAANHSGLYKFDMRPVYKSNTTNQKWQRIKSTVRFNRTDDSTQMFFEHGVETNNDELYFAFTYPYSYSTLQTELAELIDTHQNDLNGPPKSIYCQRELIVESCDGRRIDLITITSLEGVSKDEREDTLPGLFPYTTSCSSLRPPIFRDKETIFISARVHPGEVPAQHTFKGILLLLLDKDDLCAKALRSKYVFKLIPMLNPDGVYRGHFRMDQFGHNLNRYYCDPDPVSQPAIFAAKSLIDYYSKNETLALYLDLHAHASKRGCFIYGNVLDSIEDQTQNQLFCKLIALNTPHFDYEGCLFSKEHMFRIDPGDQAKGLTAEGSGRVSTYLVHRLVHSYTLECNYNTSRIGNEVPPTDIEPGGMWTTPPSVYTTNPDKYVPNSYYSVGRACVIAMLDIRGQNPCPRINKSKFRTLDRMRNSVMIDVRAKKEFLGKQINFRRIKNPNGTNGYSERKTGSVMQADEVPWRRLASVDPTPTATSSQGLSGSNSATNTHSSVSNGNNQQQNEAMLTTASADSDMSSIHNNQSNIAVRSTSVQSAPEKSTCHSVNDFASGGDQFTNGRYYPGIIMIPTSDLKGGKKASSKRKDHTTSSVSIVSGNSSTTLRLSSNEAYREEDGSQISMQSPHQLTEERVSRRHPGVVASYSKDELESVTGSMTSQEDDIDTVRAISGKAKASEQKVEVYKDLPLTVEATRRGCRGLKHLHASNRVDGIAMENIAPLQSNQFVGKASSQSNAMHRVMEDRKYLLQSIPHNEHLEYVLPQVKHIVTSLSTPSADGLKQQVIPKPKNGASLAVDSPSNRMRAFLLNKSNQLETSSINSKQLTNRMKRRSTDTTMTSQSAKFQELFKSPSPLSMDETSSTSKEVDNTLQDGIMQRSKGLANMLRLKGLPTGNSTSSDGTVKQNETADGSRSNHMKRFQKKHSSSYDNDGTDDSNDEMIGGEAGDVLIRKELLLSQYAYTNPPNLVVSHALTNQLNSKNDLDKPILMSSDPKSDLKMEKTRSHSSSLDELNKSFANLLKSNQLSGQSAQEFTFGEKKPILNGLNGSMEQGKGIHNVGYPMDGLVPNQLHGSSSPLCATLIMPSSNAYHNSHLHHRILSAGTHRKPSSAGHHQQQQQSSSSSHPNQDSPDSITMNSGLNNQNLPIFGNGLNIVSQRISPLPR